MSRLAFVPLALALLVSTARAQPALPLSPGVRPASPWGPGMPFAPTTPRQQTSSAFGNRVFFPLALPWGWGLGYGYQTFNPWTGYGYAFGGILPGGGFVAPPPVVVGSAPPAQPSVVALAEEYPATLRLQLPAAGEVWLNGEKSAGPSKEPVLISRVLKPGEQFTFYVRARWSKGDKTYEAKRAVTLGPGEHSRLMILSGDEVRD